MITGSKKSHLNPDGWERKYYGELWEIDKEELALVAEDREKFIQMQQESLRNAEDVIFPTFKAIE
mgnify:CR=1 FL=1